MTIYGAYVKVKKPLNADALRKAFVMLGVKSSENLQIKEPSAFYGSLYARANIRVEPIDCQDDVEDLFAHQPGAI